MAVVIADEKIEGDPVQKDLKVFDALFYGNVFEDQLILLFDCWPSLVFVFLLARETLDLAKVLLMDAVRNPLVTLKEMSAAKAQWKADKAKRQSE